MQRWKIGSGHLFIRHDDITTLKVDAIVNAANSRLAGGGGVDGAIHHAAGIDKLQKVCRAIITTIGELPPGEAIITPGFDLPANYIIHTVGPIWNGGYNSESELLRNAYLNSLNLAHENNIKSIAFPAISCGIYGYPVEKAAFIALTALIKGLEAGLIEEAGMVLHGEAALAIWQTAAEKIL